MDDSNKKVYLLYHACCCFVLILNMRDEMNCLLQKSFYRTSAFFILEAYINKNMLLLF